MTPVITETRSGRVRGAVERGVSRFLGVPYAAPLDGAGWLLPAEPPAPWPGERDATAFGPTAPKPGYSGPAAEILTAEPDDPGPECLNLNVWAPEGAQGLPVFVWIHGGAFRNGSGRNPSYDGAAFARDGVVCVSINYRLGAFGFLDTGDEHTNLGLRDQIAALRWVRDNIAAFGGDPARVTVAGESAGAMSVGSLLGSPLADGLFTQAVLQSGAGHHAVTRGTAQRVTRALAERLGIAPTREGFASVEPAAVIAATTALDAEIQANPDPAWGEINRNVMIFEPVIGDDVLPRLPIDAIRAGSGAAVRVLVGTNADEARFFVVPGGLIDLVPEEALIPTAAKYGLPDPAAAVAAYRAAEPAAAPGDLFCRIMSDWFFGIPAVRIAEARADAPASTHCYRFDEPSTALDGRLGACHAVEIAYVFDNLAADGVTDLAGAAPSQAVADETHAAWVRFIRGEDPGWAPYLPDRTVRVLGGGSGTVVDPDPQLRALWDGVR